MAHGHQDFIHQRNAELLAAYNRAAASPERLSYRDIVRAAIHSPASQFFISPEQVAKCFSAHIRGIRSLSAYTRTRRAKLWHIWHLCDGHYDIDTISRVIFSPAPQFYLSMQSAYVILAALRRARRKNRLKK